MKDQQHGRVFCNTESRLLLVRMRLFSCYKAVHTTHFERNKPECTPGDRGGSPAVRKASDRMNRGFYTIMAAQFFSSLADNALLIAAIALLTVMKSPAWMTPLLKLFFVLSYVLLAAFVGAFADSLPKGRVMFVTNLIKVIGCGIMFFNVHPLL